MADVKVKHVVDWRI